MLTADGKHRSLRFRSTFDAIWHRVALFALLCLSIALLLFSRAEAPFIEQARGVLYDVTAPVYEVLARPLDWADDVGDSVQGLIDIYGENERLRAENERLREWQHVALSLEARLRRYEELLNVKGSEATPVATARVIADTGGPFVHALIINAGTDDGVAKGQAAVDARGLVGRVIAAGHHASRVLLLEDLNSRIPVVIEPYGVKAILTGTNLGDPRLEFLPVNTTLNPGDRVVTAGDGGLLPPGIPVGVVAGAPGDLRVTLFADQARVNAVRLLRYEFPRNVEFPPDAAVVSGADAPGGAAPAPATP